MVEGTARRMDPRFTAPLRRLARLAVGVGRIGRQRLRRCHHSRQPHLEASAQRGRIVLGLQADQAAGDQTCAGTTEQYVVNQAGSRIQQHRAPLPPRRPPGRKSGALRRLAKGLRPVEKQTPQVLMQAFRPQQPRRDGFVLGVARRFEGQPTGLPLGLTTQTEIEG